MAPVTREHYSYTLTHEEAGEIFENMVHVTVHAKDDTGFRLSVSSKFNNPEAHAKVLSYHVSLPSYQETYKNGQASWPRARTIVISGVKCKVQRTGYSRTDKPVTLPFYLHKSDIDSQED